MGPGGRDRSANFGPPAPPKRLRGKKGGANQEHKPRGPIKERSGGRIYAVDDLDEAGAIDIDDIATSAKDDVEIDAPDAPEAPEPDAGNTSTDDENES